MEFDPATRYMIARNEFERSLTDTEALRDITILLTDDAPGKCSVVVMVFILYGVYT